MFISHINFFLCGYRYILTEWRKISNDEYSISNSPMFPLVNENILQYETSMHVHFYAFLKIPLQSEIKFIL